MCIYKYGYYIYIHCTYYHILYHVNRRICLLLTSFNVGFNWYISCGSCLTIGVFPARLSFCWLNRSELSQLASAWWLNDDCGRDLWKNRRSLTGTTGASRLTGQRDLIAIGWNETQLAASWEKKTWLRLSSTVRDCFWQTSTARVKIADRQGWTPMYSDVTINQSLLVTLCEWCQWTMIKQYQIISDLRMFTICSL